MARPILTLKKGTENPRLMRRLVKLFAPEPVPAAILEAVPFAVQIAEQRELLSKAHRLQKKTSGATRLEKLERLGLGGKWASGRLLGG